MVVITSYSIHYTKLYEVLEACFHHGNSTVELIKEYEKCMETEGHPGLEELFRITSYNVCYTKLLRPMIENAKQKGEYHYIGAGYAIKAMGFMLMLDLHGELPVQEMGVLKTNPTYDDGKKMYELIMGYLDEAIKYLEMDQEVGATSLAKGDTWNSGNVDKWLKLCHGLKARYMLRLSKKAEGTGLYNFNMDGILAEIRITSYNVCYTKLLRDVNITTLTKKLGIHGKKIVTRLGYGYCFEAE